MSVNSSTRRKWLVLLEAEPEDASSGIDPTGVGRLIESWPDARPTLYSRGRCALQVSVEAANPALALSAALWRWKDALRQAGLPEWGLVRAELVTPEELEREILAAELGAEGDATPRQVVVRRSDAVEDDLLRRALHDELTGLPGREIFLDDVRRELATGGGAASLHALMALDLGGFRCANDSVAKAAADDVLVDLAARLAATVRRTDSVAHLGDDQLAVLVEARSVGEIETLATRVLERVGAPLLGCGRPVVIVASLGVAMTSPGDDADLTILDAERAMRAAKGAGGGYRFSAAGPAPAGATRES